MIGYKCPNCASSEYKLDNNIYTCQFCGNKISEEELDLIFTKKDCDLESYSSALDERMKTLYSTSQKDSEKLTKVVEGLSAISAEMTQLKKMFATKEEIEKTVREALKSQSFPKITIENMLLAAETNEDFGLIASAIYSSIEEDLMKNPNLIYENKKFIMEYAEYKKLSEEIHYLSKCGNIQKEIYPCKYFNRNEMRLVVKAPNVIKKDNSGHPIIVEMPPVIRFYKLGLNSEDSAKASEYMSQNHWFRHRSQDSIKKIEDTFADVNAKRNYFKAEIAFFSSHHLYKDFVKRQ